jgi:hypothetical protein
MVCLSLIVINIAYMQNTIVSFKTSIQRSVACGLVFLFIFSIIPLPAFADESAAVQDAAQSGSQASDTVQNLDDGDGGVAENADPLPTGDESKPAEESALPEEEKPSDDQSEEKKPEEGKGDEGQSLLAGQQSGPLNPVAPASTIKEKLPETDATTGALVYGYPIITPPGRNGIEPGLALQYNSQNNDNGNLLGYGWNINIPYIERLNKKGTDSLYTETTFSSSLGGELVSLGGNNYGQKVDQGDFLEYALSSNTWTVKTKNGLVYKFGLDAQSRQVHPTDANKVYKWMLTEVRDANDNYIRYEYSTDQNQIYPSKIYYTGKGSTDGLFRVDFTLEDRSDTYASYRSAFKITTAKRIKEIAVIVGTDWVRKYALGYIAGDNTVRSMLGSITESGKDELGNSITNPATNFEYQKNTYTWQSDTGWGSLASSLNGGKYFLQDLNRDTYPDFIQALDPDTDDGESGAIKNIWLHNGAKSWVQNSGTGIPIYFHASETIESSTSTREQGVRLFDYNGDYYPDLVEAQEAFAPSYAARFGSYAYTGSLSWTADSPYISTFPFTMRGGTYKGTIPVDVNADGLTDLLRNQEGVGGGVQLNVGTGWGSVLTNWLPAKPLTPFKTRVVDVNADGLADEMFAGDDNGQSASYTYLQTGTGSWQQETAWASPISIQQGNLAQNNGVAFFDINADGLIDAVLDPAGDGPSGVDTFLNTGNGWLAKSDLNLPSNIFYNAIRGEDGQFVDIDSDGLVDFIFVSTSPSIYKQSGAKVSDILSKITYPTAGYTTISYKSSAQYKDGAGNLLNPGLPMVLQTVQSITANDGLGTSSTVAYEYADGKYYYASAFDRKLAGFGKVTRVDSAGNKTVSYFHQGDSSNTSSGEYQDHDSKIGKVYRVEQQNSSGVAFAVTINKWDRADLGGGRSFVKLAQSLQQMFDGNATHKDRAVSYSYSDTTGNTTQAVEWGEVTGSSDGTFADVGSDKFTTDFTYATQSGTNKSKVATEVTNNQSNSKIAETKHYYDSLSMGSLTTGNETKTEQWKSSTNYIDTERTFNSYGLVTQEKDPRDKTTDYTYDSFNLYPATVTNALSQTTQYAYDYSLGKPKQVIDVNSRVFQTVYDGFDRVIEEKQPDQATPSSLVTKTIYAYAPQSVGNQIIKTDYLDGSNSVVSYTYTDGFDRIIQSRQEMEDSGSFAVVDTIYNNVEQIYKQSLPYTGSGSNKTTPTTTPTTTTTWPTTSAWTRTPRRRLGFLRCPWLPRWRRRWLLRLPRSPPRRSPPCPRRSR